MVKLHKKMPGSKACKNFRKLVRRHSRIEMRGEIAEFKRRKAAGG